MPVIRQPTKPPHHKKSKEPTFSPLPLLNAYTNDRNARLTRVRVLDRPRMSGREGMTWTVDEEPVSKLKTGSLVILCTSTNESGIGRLSTITDLRQHWVTFALAGAKSPTCIRIPTAWATLDDLAAYTFATYFHSLQPYPEPPKSVRHGPVGPSKPGSEPPTTELPEDRDVQRRITRITKGSRHGLDEITM